MTEYENSKSDDQLEELLLLTEQMQDELEQKDRTIRELKMQLDESLTLNERLNSENRAGNIQALKNDLRKTKELLQSEIFFDAIGTFTQTIAGWIALTGKNVAQIIAIQ